MQEKAKSFTGTSPLAKLVKQKLSEKRMQLSSFTWHTVGPLAEHAKRGRVVAEKPAP